MTKKHINEEYVLPSGASTNIIKRFMSDAAFKQFTQDYEQARITRPTRVPSQKQYEIAEYAKKFGILATMDKFKVKRGIVEYAVNRVGAYYFLNNIS